MFANIIKKVKSQFALLFLEQMLSTGLALILSFATLRHWAPYLAGALSAAQAVSGMLLLVATANLEALWVHLYDKHKGEPKVLERTIGKLFLIKMGLALMSVGGLIGYLLVSSAEEQTKQLVSVVFFTGLMHALNIFPTGFMLAEKLNFLVRFRICGTLLFFCLNMFLLKTDIALFWYQIVLGVQAITWLSLFAWASGKKLGFELTGATNNIREMMNLFGIYGVATLTISLFYKLDMYIVSQVLPAKELGIYVAAIRITEVYSAVFSTVLTAYFMQKLNKLEKRSSSYYHEMAKLFRWIWAGGCFLVVLHIFLLKHIFVFALGHEYNNLLYYSSIAVAMIPFNWIAIIRGFLIGAEGIHKYHVWGALTGIIASLAITWPLTVYFGLTGALIGFVISVAISGVGSTIFMRGIPRICILITGRSGN